MILRILTLFLITFFLNSQASSKSPEEKGKKVFKKCRACHAIGEDAKNKVGPQLNGLIGRNIGSLEDYKYSKAILAYGEDNGVWDAEKLSSYLKNPKKFLGGKSKMTFRLKKQKDIVNIIAYLATIDGDGVSK